MIDIQMDENGNFLFDGSGDIVMTSTEADGVAQSITQRLRRLKGEWFLDRTKGVPYFEIILEKNPNSKLVSEILKKVILETEGVAKLNRFSLYFDTTNRQASVTFQVTTTAGETAASNEVL